MQGEDLAYSWLCVSQYEYSGKVTEIEGLPKTQKSV